MLNIIKKSSEDVLGIEIKKPKKILIWQDRALEIAQKLNIHLTKTWFSFFKRAYLQHKENYLEVTYSCLADINKEIGERYFFKVFNNKVNKLKGGQNSPSQS